MPGFVPSPRAVRLHCHRCGWLHLPVDAGSIASQHYVGLRGNRRSPDRSGAARWDKASPRGPGSILRVHLCLCPSHIPELHWVTGEEFLADPVYFHGTAEPELKQLRRQIGIEQGMKELDDDTARALFLTDWVADQWAHSGSNQPSNPDPLTARGRRGIQLPLRGIYDRTGRHGPGDGDAARVVGLKTRRADTARSGAGHVVTEIWLDDLGKWAFVDGQLGYKVTLDGTPLNARSSSRPWLVGRQDWRSCQERVQSHGSRWRSFSDSIPSGGIRIHRTSRPSIASPTTRVPLRFIPL